MSNHQKSSVLAAAFLLLAVLACTLPGGTIPQIPQGESQPTIEGSSNPGESGGSTGGACDNALYPVAVGATWRYSMSGEVASDFTRSITAMTADGFTDQDVFDSGVTRTGQWRCDAGTLIGLDPGAGAGASANVQSTNIDANFQTTAMDGVTYPAVINPGISWSQSFTIEGIQNINGQDIPSKNQTTFSCTAGGTESITVPAGTFNAVRIDCQTSVLITITMNGVDVPTDATFTSTAWHAAGVGMVKTDSTLSDGSITTIDLVTYNIP